jgi:hypothetical protein
VSTTPDPAGPAERPEDVPTPDVDDGVAPDGDPSPGAQPAPAAEADFEPEPVEVELPADAKVEATDVDVTAAVEGRTRRAPRYQNFLKAGALLGAVVGLFFGGLMLRIPGAKQLDKPGVLFSLIVIAGVCLGMAVAGLLAVYSDRRSLDRHRG